MECKYCYKENILVKSHIIPEGFYRRLRVEQDAPRLLNENDFPKKAPIGVYDKNMLCGECESIFGDWDQHVQQILSEELNGDPLVYKNENIAYLINDFDYRKMKLFFISLLWRASVSEQPFFGRVNLGPHEEIAKKHIENLDPGNSEEFSIVISKFSDPIGEKAVLDPHPEKWFGINYYRFYLGGYVVHIKVDKRRTPQPHQSIKMSEASPLIIICRDLSKSRELPVLLKILNAANQKMKAGGN